MKSIQISKLQYDLQYIWQQTYYSNFYRYWSVFIVFISFSLDVGDYQYPITSLGMLFDTSVRYIQFSYQENTGSQMPHHIIAIRDKWPFKPIYLSCLFRQFIYISLSFETKDLILNILFDIFLCIWVNNFS